MHEFKNNQIWPTIYGKLSNARTLLFYSDSKTQEYVCRIYMICIWYIYESCITYTLHHICIHAPYVIYNPSYMSVFQTCVRKLSALKNQHHFKYKSIKKVLCHVWTTSNSIRRNGIAQFSVDVTEITNKASSRNIVCTSVKSLAAQIPYSWQLSRSEVISVWVESIQATRHEVRHDTIYQGFI